MLFSMNLNEPPFDVVYQIFPDRFAIGSGRSVADKVRSGLYGDGAVALPWQEALRTDVSQSVQHYGGDLSGIAEKADYLANLGVEAVYLTPIHPSPSYHRYDATDYWAVAPELGGMEAFEALVQALHAKGIRIILDVVLNHVSDRHPHFLAAVSDPSSPYRAFFSFDASGAYRCWHGHPGLPELNLEHPAVIETYITGPGSVLRFWADRGVDGFRLDCANDLGIPLCDLITRTAKAIRGDLFIIGETFHWGVDWLQGLDAIQSYVVTQSILDLLGGTIVGRQFGLTLDRLVRDARPFGGLQRSWTMLSSHDFPRVFTSLEGDRKRLELALLLQFTLPGTPMIYYGDEIGLTGGRDPLNRGSMVWDEGLWDRDILTLHKQMIHLRRSRKELRDGAFCDLSDWASNGTVGFLRTSPEDPREFCLVFVNPTAHPKRFTAHVPASRMFAGLPMKDLLTGRTVLAGPGTLEIDLPPLSASVHVPEYRLDPRYDFAKRL